MNFAFPPHLPNERVQPGVVNPGEERGRVLWRLPVGITDVLLALPPDDEAAQQELEKTGGQGGHRRDQLPPGGLGIGKVVVPVVLDLQLCGGAVVQQGQEEPGKV